MAVPMHPIAATASVAALILALTSCTSTAPQTAPAPTFGSIAATPDMPGMAAMPPGHMSGGESPPPTPVAGDTVAIGDFAFAPQSLTVKVGSTVTWTNKDEEPHSVVAPGGAFHSPTMGTGGTYSFTFTEAGTFDYLCGIHPFMTATVVVTP